MKRFLVLWMMVSVGWLWADGESIDLDQVVSEESEHLPSGLGLHLYADFDVDWQHFPGMDASWVFSQNHRDLLLQSAAGSPVDLLVDVLLPTSLFGMGIPLSLPFPGLGETSVLGASHLWAGVLQVPFGEFSFHHLYGGREFKQSGLVPDLWTDTGLQWTISPGPGLTLDLFLGNGFDDPNFTTFLTPKVPDQHPKGVSARARQDFAPGWFASVSVFRNQHGLDSEPAKALTMAGLDLSAKTGPLTYRFSGLFALVQGGAAEWNRSGWYGEVQYLITPSLFLRTRGGTMHPKSTTPAQDTVDANVAAIWKTGPVEWDLTVFADAPLARPDLILGSETKHQILLKVLYTI